MFVLTPSRGERNWASKGGGCTSKRLPLAGTEHQRRGWQGLLEQWVPSLQHPWNAVGSVWDLLWFRGVAMAH